MVTKGKNVTTDDDSTSKSCDFDELLVEELKDINKARGADPKNRDVAGLAFSGGGIRSATFNLGVLQALAELRVLRKFDYLSTVSGGGYIGSWLTAWMAHDKQSIETIEEELAPNSTNSDGPVLAAGDYEPHALKHLRSYTNYLKPRGGFFSLDALTAFTTWLRNTLLNQLILIAAFAVLLLASLGVGWFVKVSWSTDASFLSHWPAWMAASVLMAVAVGVINANLLFTPQPSTSARPWYVRKAWVIGAAIVPLVASSFLISLTLPSLVPGGDASGGFFSSGIGNVLKNVRSLLIFLVLPMALCAIAFVVSTDRNKESRRDTNLFLYPFGFLVAALLGLIVFLPVIARLLTSTPFVSEANSKIAVLSNILSFGPPLILVAFSLAVFAYVGLIGRIFDEHQREWWSRYIAMVFFAAVAWLLLFGFSIWGSLVVDWLRYGVMAAITWLATSGVGVLAGKSASTSGRGANGSNKWIELIAQAAPYVFVPGLCLVVSYWVNQSLLGSSGGVPLGLVNASCIAEPSSMFCNLYSGRLAELNHIFQHPGHILSSLLIAAAIASILAWRVDINLFSFHSFYRNRLTRAYLAAGIAERTRSASVLPLTGMSDKDSPKLKDLPSRPYQLLNTALNITSSKHLSWQERKAASFCFTKKHCGYYLPGQDKADNYCSTDNFLKKIGVEKAWLSLSLPMTISGAAASPNSGFHTSAPLAFLMTVFNVRLGWWMQNTRDLDSWQSGGPSFGFWYLLKELTANVDESSPFVYLSDGGHFENLGIYELIRRRCQFILACDAGADPEFVFDDLGNAIRKCYIDLGVRIDIDVSKLRPDKDGPNKGRSGVQSAIGLVYYPKDGQTKASAEVGLLLYIKASLAKTEATDIEHYKATHKDFPHETTLNQFFSESQFESYRKLGYTLCRRAILSAQTASVAAISRGTPQSVADVLKKMSGHVKVNETRWPMFSGALNP